MKFVTHDVGSQSRPSSHRALDAPAGTPSSGHLFGVDPEVGSVRSIEQSVSDVQRSIGASRVCTVSARSATCNEKGIAGVFLSGLHFNARRVVAPSCRDLRCSPMVQNTSYAAEAHGSLLVLVLLALIVGAAAGGPFA
jgi:hypothetical protein